VFLLVTFFITYRDVKRKRLSVGFDSVLFGVLGVMGILLLLLWTATNHQAAARNLNLLWALPTHLIAAIAFVRRPRWLKPYFLVVAILSGLLLITWPILPQMLHYSLIPLVMAIGIRSIARFAIKQPAG